MSGEHSLKKPIRVAAVQMRPELGNVDANLEKARQLVRQAFSAGAQWVILPEFFTTGMIFDDSLLCGHRPLDGAPMQLLQELAREGGATVGGSYLAESGGHVYNTFVLAHRDGQLYTHDKDFPSGPIEHAYYAGGEDAEFVTELRAYGVPVSGEPIPSRQANNQVGVFVLPGINVGAAMCWEMIRRRTVTRMLGKADMILACSAWADIDPTLGFPGMTRQQIVDLDAVLLAMLQGAPNRLARMLGVPVIHANFVGTLQATQLFGQRVTFATRFCGESKVVDARGATVACRPAAEGEGIVVADLSLERTLPEDKPGDAFWMAELSPVLRELWYNQGAVGREYYLRTARPFRTGGSKI